MDTKANRDNVENQRIVEDLVRREVYHCISQLMYHLAKTPQGVEDSEYDYDEVVRICSRPTYVYEFEYLCGMCDCPDTTWEKTQDEQDEYLDWVDCDEDDWLDACPNCGKDTKPFNLHCTEGEAKEAYEFWAVSSWIAAKLAEKGELVGELFDFHVWGRCCTGQAIYLDSVWIDIASDMGILSGQKYSWSK